MTPFDPRLPIIAAEARVKTCHVFHCWQAMREMGKRFHMSALANRRGPCFKVGRGGFRSFAGSKA